MSYINWFKRVFVGNGSDNTAEGAIIRADIDSGTIVAV